jgi:hypothetical protein
MAEDDEGKCETVSLFGLYSLRAPCVMAFVRSRSSLRRRGGRPACSQEAACAADPPRRGLSRLAFCWSAYDDSMTALPIRTGLRIALTVTALALGASARATADEPPLPPPRPPELGTPAKPSEPPPPPPQTPKAQAASTCLANLIADGASAEAATAPPASAEGCGIAEPVRLSSITAEGEAVSLPDRPLIACEFASVLADYVRLIVAPLGQATLHAKVAAIETGPGYDCRTQDRIAGAKISAHAKGLAVDFMAITLADKRRILVERQTGAEEVSYFRAIRTAACGWFTTVLGPGSDAYHANNMHMDIEPHGSSASYRICQ